MTSLRFDYAQLENGLTLIGEYNPQAETFAAGYFVKTGARDEREEVAGVSHFLEHMMFKGTARRSAEDINREFDELGANYNAYTSDERTVYYASVLSSRREALLELLSDMMRPALRERDFEVEKQVILEEIAMYEDRPNFKVFEEGNRRYYQGHPLGNSVLGSVASIQALTPEAMRAYFEARYAADNLLLVVAGNYAWEELKAQVAALTRAWRPSGATREYPPLRPRHGSEALASDKVKRVHLALYAPGVSAQDPRRYAAAVLANVLGDETGSRLYWALVDKGLAESASLMHDGADQVGSFIGYVSTGPEELPQVMEALGRELQAVQEEGVKADEWERAKRKLATALTLRGETPFGRLMSLGVSYLYQREYLSLQQTVDTIMALTPGDAAALLSARPFDKLYTFRLEPAGG
jgi:predicted Zn-dependent peptidase